MDRRNVWLFAVLALIVVWAANIEGQPPPKDKFKGKGKGPLDIERALVKGGIQWFATWESARREAERSGRPILLVSAAPHCAGVSGVW